MNWVSCGAASSLTTSSRSWKKCVVSSGQLSEISLAAVEMSFFRVNFISSRSWKNCVVSSGQLTEISLHRLDLEKAVFYVLVNWQKSHYIISVMKKLCCEFWSTDRNFTKSSRSWKKIVVSSGQLTEILPHHLSHEKAVFSVLVNWPKCHYIISVLKKLCWGFGSTDKNFTTSYRSCKNCVESSGQLTKIYLHYLGPEKTVPWVLVNWWKFHYIISVLKNFVVSSGQLNKISLHHLSLEKVVLLVLINWPKFQYIILVLEKLCVGLGKLTKISLHDLCLEKAVFWVLVNWLKFHYNILVLKKLCCGFWSTDRNFITSSLSCKKTVQWVRVDWPKGPRSIPFYAY